MTNHRPPVHPTSRRAFSLVELMIVIAILGLLVGIGVFVGSRVRYEQKVSQARATMQILSSVAEDFAAADPLASRNRRLGGVACFGQFPGYPIPDDIPSAVEPRVSGFDELGFRDDITGLNNVLMMYLTGNPRASSNNWITNAGGDLNRWQSILSFYTLAQLYAPTTLDLIPEDIVADPPTDDALLVDPDGNLNASDSRAVDVNGLVDPWGEPYQYLLYVKLEAEIDIGSGEEDPVWAVAEVMPVFMSFGAEPEKIDQALTDPDRWIWSEDLPQPYAKVNDLNDPSNENAGWIRLVPADLSTTVGLIPQ